MKIPITNTLTNKVNHMSTSNNVEITTHTEQKLTLNKHDKTWIISLFGTAVGAGILFLPINIGVNGLWPLITMALLAGPMTFLAHRGLARFILSSNSSKAEFTDVVEEHFGHRFGFLISLLYFLSIFPILMIYGVGLTNTVESYIVNQMGMAAPPRIILSGVLVAAMIGIMMAGEKTVLRAFEVIVYPLVFILFGISIYMIPNWQMPNFADVPDAKAFTQTLWLAIPTTIFAFSHTAAISSFSVAQKRHYGEHAGKRVDFILKHTSMMLITFVLFFVFSCALSLTPAQLAEAKAQNISILSYLANVTGSGLIASFGPFIACIAIISSFFGHFLGGRESLDGIIAKHTNLKPKLVNKLTIAILFFSVWYAAVKNPSVLGIMETFSGPVIALILFILPMYAISKVEAMKHYRGKTSNIFVTVIGLIAISAILYNLL